MISKEKWTWEITQPSIGRMAEDRETQFPVRVGCKDTLAPTLGAGACAFQELRRRVLALRQITPQQYPQ